MISPGYDLVEMESILSNDSWYCWIVESESGGKIALVELSLRSIVDGCLSSPVPYLEGFYQLPPERGKGQGTEIIEMIKSWCRDRGFTELATDTELSNSKAQAFYERLGFEKVAQIVEYKTKI